MLFSGNPSMPNPAISPAGSASLGLSFNDYLLGQVRHVVPEAAGHVSPGFPFQPNASNTPEIIQGSLVSLSS